MRACLALLLTVWVYVWLLCTWTHADVLLSHPARDGAIVVQLKGILGDSPEVNFRGPFGVTAGADDRIYVADDLAHTIYVFDSQHHLRETIGKHGTKEGELAWVDAVAVDTVGNLYIADTGNDRVQILNPQRRVIRTFGKRGQKPGEFRNPRGIALDSQHNIYVVDWNNYRIQVFDQRGHFLRQFGGFGTGRPVQQSYRDLDQPG